MRMVQESIPITDFSQSQLPYLASQGGGDASFAQGQQSMLPSLGMDQGVAAPPTSAWTTQQQTTITGGGMAGGGTAGGGVIPRPPRARPSSAGTRRGSGSGPVHIASQSPTNSPLPPRRGKITSISQLSSLEPTTFM